MCARAIPKLSHLKLHHTGWNTGEATTDPGPAGRHGVAETNNTTPADTADTGGGEARDDDGGDETA